jgi:hypothetical protein
LQNSCHTFLDCRRTAAIQEHTTYVELFVKPEILTSYIYGPTFGNAEIRLFLFAAQCFNTASMQKGYPNYIWDLIRYVKG